MRKQKRERRMVANMLAQRGVRSDYFLACYFGDEQIMTRTRDNLRAE